MLPEPTLIKKERHRLSRCRRYQPCPNNTIQNYLLIL